MTFTPDPDRPADPPVEPPGPVPEPERPVVPGEDPTPIVPDPERPVPVEPETEPEPIGA